MSLRFPVISASFLVASRLRDGGVIAYHSALVFHGCAYAWGSLVQVVAPGQPGEVCGGGFRYDFMVPPRGLVLGEGPPCDGVKVVEYKGTDIRVTTIERTVVDLFDRPEQGGDILIDSLNLVHEFDEAALVRHARAVGSATAAGCLGWWLERQRDQFGRPADDDTLRELRALAPREPRVGLPARPGKDMLVDDWNVTVPKEYAEDPTLSWGY